MKYTLPNLPYSYDAMEPFIDEATMTIHHAKHHQAYIDKLNVALEKHSEIAETPLEELLKNLESVAEDVRVQVKNHGGGHLNHSLFWEILAPKNEAQNAPSGELSEAINKSFGNFDAFKEQFTNASLNQFGSGWAWFTLSNADLSRAVHPDSYRGESREGLRIYSLPNQDSPLSKNDIPLMGLDVWEHAYYLKYQNKRADYITAWWNVINWNKIEASYKKAIGKS